MNGIMNQELRIKAGFRQSLHNFTNRPIDFDHRFGLSPYCKPDCVNFTAQYGFAAPPVTLHFWPFTDPAARVEK
jgi:hypothetical protein